MKKKISTFLKMYLTAGLLIGVLAGFTTGAFIGHIGEPKYVIESVAMDSGIEYTLLAKTLFRSDVIYKSMNADTVWTIWFGLYANREGIGYHGQQEAPQSDTNNGVYNPDDTKNNKKSHRGMAKKDATVPVR